MEVEDITRHPRAARGRDLELLLSALKDTD